MTTTEMILAQFNRISADSDYTCIDLNINDFEGFDEDLIEVDREFVGSKAVEEVLKWLKEDADCIHGIFYR